jgi:signal transduction histidine kinase
MDSQPRLASLDEQISAPRELLSYRKERYRGDDISVRMDELHPEDRSAVAAIYQRLLDLLPLLRAGLNDSERCLGELSQLLEQPAWKQALHDVRRIGKQGSSPEHPRLQQVIHDIRGGALQALLMHLQFIDMGLMQPDDLPRLFFLTRDHLKIMRNAVRDIDPDGAARDQEEREHSLSLLIEKWQHSTHMLPDRTATVYVESHSQGSISERCVEFAALDRVIYNLINNAVRFTASGSVLLGMLSVPEEAPESVRFIVANPIADEHRERLRERFGDQLAQLFIGGFTTGGSGAGLRICAEFVANAYGVEPLEHALAGGYVGAKIVDDAFVSWVHWPLVAD